MLARYFWNLMVALDQLLNAVLLGDPDETISSRAAKSQDRLLWRILGALIEFVDPGHLAKYREDDEGGNAL